VPRRAVHDSRLRHGFGVAGGAGAFGAEAEASVSAARLSTSDTATAPSALNLQRKILTALAEAGAAAAPAAHVFAEPGAVDGVRSRSFAGTAAKGALELGPEVAPAPRPHAASLALRERAHPLLTHSAAEDDAGAGAGEVAAEA
jgi:hypothetical protein